MPCLCLHENAFLIGTAEGIRCRRCGQLFATFADIYPEPVPTPEEANEIPAPEPEVIPEKPKRTRKKKEA